MLKFKDRRNTALWGALVVLVLFSASLILRIKTLPLDNDEIWEIWQTFGTPQQIVLWTSSTEYPTFMILLGWWKDLVGLHPYVLRYLTVLMAIPGAAFMYRAVRRSNGVWAGIFAALAYGAFPISLDMGLMTRSYVIAFSALPLALWLSSRYFEHPTFLRGVALGVTLYALYVGTVSIVPALGLFGLYILLLYPRQVWRGILPAVVSLALILPDYLTNKSQATSNYSSGAKLFQLAPLPQAWFDFFNFFTRTPIWYVLVIAAVGAGVYAIWRLTERRKRVSLLFWLGWFLLIPLLLYVLEPRLGFFPPRRYAWWYVFGLALFVGMGLAYLPRLGRWISAGVLVLALLSPLRLSDFSYIITPLGENMSWLRDHMQASDALYLDPNIKCNFPEEWDYYTRVFFPEGLRYVSEPEGTQRLWYVASQDDASRLVEAELAKTRIPERFVGPPGCIFRLYEAPPDEAGILFENGMRFHGYQIMDGDRPLNYPLVFREQQSIRVRLWWSVDKPVAQDYSVNLSLTNPGRVYDATDSAPQLIYPENAPVETSRWTPEQIYVEERTLTTPVLNYRGHFNLSLVVYWFGQPDERFGAPGVQPDGSLLLEQLAAVAW